MRSRLQKLRIRAFVLQGGDCFYCGRPMLVGRTGRLKGDDCTAEHLMPRKSGGLDQSDNVVAACWRCNNRRHRRKADLDPATFKALVRRQLARQAARQGLSPT